MRKITVAGLIALVLMTATIGCNTARGAGKDLQDTGKHIENIGK